MGINTRDWVDSTHDWDYWRALVNAALSLRATKAMELIIIVIIFEELNLICVGQPCSFNNTCLKLNIDNKNCKMRYRCFGRHIGDFFLLFFVEPILYFFLASNLNVIQPGFCNGAPLWIERVIEGLLPVMKTSCTNPSTTEISYIIITYLFYVTTAH